jgi:hypothetical protein
MFVTIPRNETACDSLRLLMTIYGEYVRRVRVKTANVDFLSRHKAARCVVQFSFRGIIYPSGATRVLGASQ